LGKIINPEVRIESTSHCNFHCIICPRDELTRPRTTMPLEHFKKLVREAKELGAELISIFGFGEPLMDRGLAEKVQFCTDLGLDTFITTNGSLLNVEEAHALLNAGLSHLRFSCHGTKNYSKVHRGGEYSTTIRNIQNFIAINRVKYNHACKISVSVIPMFDEDTETIKNMWEPYVDWLEIWRPHNWTDGKKYRDVEKDLR